MNIQVIDDFKKAMHNSGLTPPSEINADGTINRFSTNGNSSDKAGYYALFDNGNGLYGGFFGDWRSGVYQTWHRKSNGKQLNEQDKQKIQEDIKKKKQEAEQQRQIEAKEAAQKARKIWDQALTAGDSHPYLYQKRVSAYGLKENRNSLIVPRFDISNDNRGLQFISTEKKVFLKGMSVRGCFFQIGEIKDGCKIYLAEGYATGATIYEATNEPVICTFNAGNMKVVAKKIYEQYPHISITVCADNDQQSAGNTGLSKGREAAQAVNGHLTYPVFQDGNKGSDFNDLQNAEGLQAVKEQIQRAEKLASKLHISADAQEYAEIYLEEYGYLPEILRFHGCTYSTKVIFSNEGPKVQTTFLGAFTLKVEHYQLQTDLEDEPEYGYNLKITPKGERPISFNATADDLRSATNFQRLLLQKSKCSYEGNAEQHKFLLREITRSDAPKVRQIHSIGYDEGTGFYVFKHFAIDISGKKVEKNNQGFFTVDEHTQLRPVKHATVEPRRSRNIEEIYKIITSAWGEKAIVAMAWTVSVWFIHLVKEELGFHPFLSFYGDTQSGKSRLTRILNALQCIDSEGIPMSKVNTSKGEIRKIAQSSSLILGMLEANNSTNTRFNLETLLPLYNSGNPLQLRAQKTNDITTAEIHFKSSFLFVQNVEPFRSKAQKERVISLQFNQGDITENSAEAFKQIVNIPMAELASFFIAVMEYRNFIENYWQQYYEDAKKKIIEVDARTIENHAIILTFHNILMKIMNMSHDLTPFINELAYKKYKQINVEDESLADLFFSNLMLIDADEPVIGSDGDVSIPACLDTDPDEDKLYINLGLAEKHLKRNGLWPNMNIDQLRKSLIEHPALISSNTKKRIQGRSMRAWIFRLSELEAFDDES